MSDPTTPKLVLFKQPPWLPIWRGGRIPRKMKRRIDQIFNPELRAAVRSGWVAPTHYHSVSSAKVTAETWSDEIRLS